MFMYFMLKIEGDASIRETSRPRLELYRNIDIILQRVLKLGVPWLRAVLIPP